MKIKKINVHLTEEQIAERIAEMGAEISKEFGDEPVFLICILTYGITFFYFQSYLLLFLILMIIKDSDYGGFAYYDFGLALFSFALYLIA